MAIQTKKLHVLHQLSQEVDPISLEELLQRLEGSHAERSVRRWLFQLIEEGLVEKIGSRKSARYRVIQRTQREPHAGGNCFSKESKDAIARVRLPIFQRMPTTYADAWIEAYQPNSDYYIPLETRLQLQKAGKRLRNDDPAGTYARQIFNRLLIDLSYNSSRLEGNTYSLLDTQKLVLEGASAEGKLDEEKIMILNHKEAIRYLVESASKIQVCDDTIYTLHYLLADTLVEPRYAGKVRDHGVRIGGSTYMPFEDPKQLQTRLSRIIAKAARIRDPYEQSFFLLVHISYLQAFADVNKRLARLAANIPLIKNNLVPQSFNDVEREEYTSAIIAIYELQDIHPLLDLYAFSYMRTCAMYDSTVKIIGFDEVRARYRQERRSIIRNIILSGLTGQKMQDFILFQIQKLVREEEQKAVQEDIAEDLREIDQSRLAGLGVTLKEFQDWVEKSNGDNGKTYFLPGKNTV